MDTTFTVLSRNDFQSSFLYPNFQKGEGRIKKFSDIQSTQFLLLECMLQQNKEGNQKKRKQTEEYPSRGREVPESQQ